MHAQLEECLNTARHQLSIQDAEKARLRTQLAEKDALIARERQQAHAREAALQVRSAFCLWRAQPDVYEWRNCAEVSAAMSWPIVYRTGHLTGRLMSLTCCAQAELAAVRDQLRSSQAEQLAARTQLEETQEQLQESQRQNEQVCHLL